VICACGFAEHSERRSAGEFQTVANARDQAWIEASTKGAVLLFVSSEAE
jgi:hypothetical protein